MGINNSSMPKWETANKQRLSTGKTLNENKDKHSISSGPWYSRPMFVSSTFKDMQAERDHLRDIVFPELERRMNKRQCHLETVDLRWGVETVTTQEQEDKELLVLKVCLDEIERCRPFLIVILGDRYGWVPPERRMKAAVDEKGYSANLAGKSVTALEIDYGVFANSDQKKRSLFYFRDIENYDDMPPDTRQIYSDYYSDTPESQVNFNKLQALKLQIEEDDILKDKTRHYSVKWKKDGKNDKLIGIEAWAKQIVKDIWQELDKDSREFAAKTDPSWQGQERKYLEEFIELRSRNFVGRETLIQDLKIFALSNTQSDTSGISIQSGAGSGKSAIFATLKRSLEYEKSDVLILSHAAGISLRSGNIDALIRRWIQELARHLELDNDDPSKGLDSFDEKKELFAQMLSQASVNTRVICMIDALNQFERSIFARYMTWLPELLPKNVRLITTAIPGDETNTLSKRANIKTIDLPKLDYNEAGNIVQTLCRRYHKTLHPDIINSLISIKHPDSTPAAGNPLWLCIAVEHLLLMDEDDFMDAEGFSGTAEEKLHLFILKVVQGFPPDIESLYESLFTRIHERFGKRQGIDWIPDMMDFIAASRNGLRESDIRHLLNRNDDKNFELQFALVRRYLRAHLMQRGNQGLWDFTHTQIRLNLRKRRLANQGYYKKCHLQIANHFDVLHRKDPVRISEIMYHLMEGDNKIRSITYYGGRLTSEEEDAATQIISEAILFNEHTATNTGLSWITDLLKSEKINEENIDFFGRLCARINFNLLDALKDQANVATRIILIKANIGIVEVLRSKAPDSALLTRDLSVTLNKLGDLYIELGKPAPALENHEKSLEILEELHSKARDSVLSAEDLSVSIDSLGNLCLELGEPARALENYKRSYQIREELYIKAPDNAENAHGISISLKKLGDTHTKLGEFARALENYEKSREIAEELYSKVPDNEKYARIFSISLSNLGDLYIKLGKPVRAIKSYEQALEIAESLHKKAPDSSRYALDLSISFRDLGKLYSTSNQPSRALEKYEKSLEILEELHRKAPDSAAYAQNLSVSLNWLGDHYIKLGEPERSRENYEKSFEIVNILYSNAPDSALYALNLSISYERLGSLHIKLGEPARALENLKKALDIREQLHSNAPDSAEYALGLAVSLNKLGDLCIQLGKPETAIENYEKALEISVALYSKAPEIYAWDLSSSFSMLGNLYIKLNKPSPALENHGKSFEIREKLYRKTPDNEKYALGLSVSLNTLGDLYIKLGEPASAIENYEEALEIVKKLHSKAPESSKYAQVLSVSLNTLGDLYIQVNEPERALEHHEKSLRMRQEFYNNEPDSVEYAQNLSVSFQRLAYLYSQLGKPSFAIENYEEALEIAEKLYIKKPDSEKYAQDLSATHFNIGSFYKDSGNMEKMRCHFQKTKNIIFEMKQRGMRLNEPLHQALAMIESIPKPHPSANPEHSAQLNIKYQKKLADWQALPWWKRILVKAPERPSGI